jgi:hypothetical protein
MFKKIGANEEIEGVTLIDPGRLALYALLNPAPPLKLGNVHEFKAHGARINPARLLLELAIDRQLGMRSGLEKPQGIKVGFEISPLAKEFKDPFVLALPVGRFYE